MDLSKSRSKDCIVIALLLLVTLLLRVWDFPHRNELRHSDEIPYCFGSLELLEGMVPPYKYAPGGPQTWAGWAYLGGVSVWHFVHPGPEERAVAAQVRPFVAVNHTLWDNYADLSHVRNVWILFAWPAIFASVVSAFRIGRRQAGLPGGVLMGSTMSLLPIFVGMSEEARPYMMAWALGVIAIDLMMVADTAKRRIAAAIVMGLAIGSRIDMLLLLPLVWSELWQRRRRDGLIKPFLLYHLVAIVTCLVVGPWLLTNLIGDLRTIVTVRLATPAGGPVPKAKVLGDLFWRQGLGIIFILCIAGLFIRPTDGARRRWLRNFFVLLAIASIFKATGFGLQHQGGPLVILVVLAAVGLAPLGAKDMRLAWGIAALALILPAVQTVRLIHAHDEFYVKENAVPWLEQHVPAGTPIYDSENMQPVIPTIQASDRLWAQVNDNNAWEKKFQAGLERFHLFASDIPRALSDENMLDERGGRRNAFILGSRPNVNRKRFDLYSISGPIFSVAHPVDEILKHGGVLICREYYGYPVKPDTSALGEPIAAWHAPAGTGVFIYASDDVKAKLKRD